MSLALVFVGFVGGEQAYANDKCTSTVSSTTVSFDTVSVPDSLPVGGTIKTVQLAQVVSCPPGETTQVGSYNGYSQMSTTVNGAFETGTPGIGVVITEMLPSAMNLTSAPGTGFFQLGPLTSSKSFLLTFTLVKTAKEVQRGMPVNMSQLIFIGLDNQSAIGNWISLTNTRVGAPTCTPTSSAQPVPLPTISATALKSTGMIAGRTPFKIVLSCQSASNLYVTLTDVNNFSNATNMLTLDPSSTAKNVQLQILKPDGTPASYGPDSPAPGNPGQWSAGKTQTGPVTIPLTVQYIATGTATAGTVKAMATYTLSYQ